MSTPLITTSTSAELRSANVAACAVLCMAMHPGERRNAPVTARSISSLSEPMLTRCATAAGQSPEASNGSAS